MASLSINIILSNLYFGSNGAACYDNLWYDSDSSYSFDGSGVASRSILVGQCALQQSAHSIFNPIQSECI